MTIINTMTECRFMDSMADSGRGDSWSHDGLRSLYNYLEEISDGTGHSIEFDPIAFDCEFTEYDSIEDVATDYGDEIETAEDVENLDQFCCWIRRYNGSCILGNW